MRTCDQSAQEALAIELQTLSTGSVADSLKSGLSLPDARGAIDRETGEVRTDCEWKIYEGHKMASAQSDGAERKLARLIVALPVTEVHSETHSIRSRPRDDTPDISSS